MAQQTSVEWFINEILKHDKSFVEFYGAEIEQAKAIHQAEIIESHLDGQSLVSCKDEYAEQYYNDKFKNK